MAKKRRVGGGGGIRLRPRGGPRRRQRRQMWRRARRILREEYVAGREEQCEHVRFPRGPIEVSGGADRTVGQAPPRARQESQSRSERSILRSSATTRVNLKAEALRAGCDCLLLLEHTGMGG
jgi:hypothetical protein